MTAFASSGAMARNDRRWCLARDHGDRPSRCERSCRTSAAPGPRSAGRPHNTLSCLDSPRKSLGPSASGRHEYRIDPAEFERPPTVLRGDPMSNGRQSRHTQSQPSGPLPHFAAVPPEVAASRRGGRHSQTWAARLPTVRHQTCPKSKLCELARRDGADDRIRLSCRRASVALMRLQEHCCLHQH